MAMRVAVILLVERPDVIVSTGAAPGYFALRLGKFLGLRTIWVDSIANVERLSLSGQRVGRFADLWLTQWPHLAAAGGPSYHGSVL
jgi:UDP-N-acetylglucosamine:LPS N-acetylglucosamine transferase